jgi:cell division protein FtsI/penicillin-binding protein 2
LDSNTQEWAEAALTENYRHIQGYGASNASMIYLDSTNGDVL